MCRQEVVVCHFDGCYHRLLQFRAVQRCREALWTDQPCRGLTQTKRTKFSLLACPPCRGVDPAEEEAFEEKALGPPARFWWSGTCPQSADLSANPRRREVGRNELSPRQVQAQAQAQVQGGVQNQNQGQNEGQNLDQPDAEAQPMFHFHYNPTWHHAENDREA